MQKKTERSRRGSSEEALKLNPASQMARNNLGIALANSNATAQAVANWQSTSDPATAHNNLAAVWIEKGNYPEARRNSIWPSAIIRHTRRPCGTWNWWRAWTAARLR